MSDCSENLRYKLSLNIKFELWKFNIKYEWLQWKFTLQIEFKH